MQFYYVGIDSLYRIRDFVDYYGLKKYNNVVVGKDYSFSFRRIPDLHSIPSSIIYDEQKRLRAKINGSFNVKEIVRVIEKIHE